MSELEPRPEADHVDEPEVIGPGGERLRSGGPEARLPVGVPLRLRLKIAGGLALAGVAFIALGVLLTLTIIGAVIGIPIALVGIGLVAAAVLVLSGKAAIILTR